MCSFEVHHVDVAQKLRKLKGGSYAAIVAYERPSQFQIFELYQHDVPQKSTFFIENSDSEEKSVVL